MMGMRISKRQSGWKIAAAMLALIAIPKQMAHAKLPLGKNWSAAEQVSMNEIDHSEFDALLKKYVDGDGYVDYTAWTRTAADRKALQTYLANLGRASTMKPARKAAQLAFWIDAYNAVTLEGILDVYPTSSIRNHTAKIAGFNIWKELPLQVGGESFTLDAMEHQVLRKMGEPRIHFAIVCASVGCPRLRNEAFTADRIEEQLAANAADFFSRPKNLQFDAQSSTLRLSSILDWFGSDFGKSQEAQIAYLRPYFPKNVQNVVSRSQVTVKFLDYDWNLNDQSHKNRTAAKP